MTTIVIPAREVLAGTTRLTALEAAGFSLDTDGDRPRVYARDEVAPGLDRTPRSSSCCVARRQG